VEPMNASWSPASNDDLQPTAAGAMLRTAAAESDVGRVS
jgi:hypothetical protein